MRQITNLTDCEDPRLFIPWWDSTSRNEIQFQMIKLEPAIQSRSVGIHLDEDLITALDEICITIAEDEVPSRSEVARSLLWAGVAIVRSRDPQVVALLKAVADAESAYTA